MEKLRSIMSKILKMDKKDINEKVSRSNTEEWDSFNHLLLISEIEKEMKIKFTIQEVEQIRTFKDFIEIVTKKERQRL